ncbi:MAG: CPBP family intramembrane metalloprotease [Gammaproteobacteria bacterium]|nr:CPBP family intramembrane metalloprotease [Gammaproteobacteria bacterium]MDH3374896.1 CPBP family intramembrane metalloprotease [Gammaproteobacteria bacterium]MDH3409965.1 CPBP family intramembrane metalloprotease [Gammaproteobacteria bacterium]
MERSSKTAESVNDGSKSPNVRHAHVLVAAVLLMLAWLAVNAIWGITSTEPTMIAGWLARVAGLGSWAGLLTATIAVALGYGMWRRTRSLAGLSLMLLAYLAGVAAGESLRDLAQAGILSGMAGRSGALADRAFLLFPVLPMLAAAWLTDRNLARYPLRIGRWHGAVTSNSADNPTRLWGLWFGMWLLAIFLPLVLMMQASVNFMPVTSGRLWSALAPLTLLALLNAVGEELVFRGLVLPSLIPLTGTTSALWLQGVFFGLHHWGSSPNPVSGLSMAVVLTFVAYLWGRSVLQTRGLAWAVLTHMSLDCALFWAHFV